MILGGININMRCIEIWDDKRKAQVKYMININMRCIEISFKIAVRGKLPD